MALNKWALLDYGRVAHWWLGAEGTACGRDFRVDIRQSLDTAEPLCSECLSYLRTHGVAAL